MSDMLSQEEIDALLSAVNKDDNSGNSGNDDKDKDVEDELTDEEKDVLGEIGNISMGTSATTLYTLLNNKVSITTPVVSVLTWDELKKEYPIPYVGTLVEFTEGLKGFNMLILKDEDAKKIADLMMGGDGTNTSMELSEMVLSAVGEAMNQMVGSAATSLSNMLQININISPPKVYTVKFDSNEIKNMPIYGQKVVRIAFKMVVGSIIDSQIMQLLPLDFAKGLVSKLLNKGDEKVEDASKEAAITEAVTNSEADKVISYEDKAAKSGTDKIDNKAVKVKPVLFQDFDQEPSQNERQNISLIKDVPLEITVELGRTHKMIKEILELGPGSIIELNKMAGEPVDILVNGKYVAKGEVVVIDENFGVRISEILH